MTDCPNAAIRDRLPDLLHERLDASARAVVMAHVDGCADCRAELVLLREAHVVLSSGVRTVDAASIARVVVARTAASQVRAIPRRIRVDWRLAAAVVFVAIGGASFAALRSVRQRGVAAPPVESAIAVAPMIADTPRVGATAKNALQRPGADRTAEPVVVAQSAELSAAGGVSDLTDNDLKALLSDLEKLDAVPPIEPEPVTVRVVPGRGSSE